MKIFAELENDGCIPNDLDYGKHANKVKEYLDIYEDIQVELNYVLKFDATTNIATTYIDKKIIERKERFQAEESFPMTEKV